MKELFILLINFYQKFISPVKGSLFGHNICRFTPRCSEYAKISIKEKGVLRGGALSIIRILKCQPYYNKAI